jgi:hypothetical protein
MRILFIAKKNEIYGSGLQYTRRSSGLYNSTRFIAEGLAARGVHSKIIELNDNNDIDREVTAFKPDVVVIEALWVVPEKFDILQKLHPNVSWCVHLHSHMSFLALEGIAMGWIKAYAEEGVGLIANSYPSYQALRCFLSEDEVIYLPNVYINTPRRKIFRDKPVIDVGCFGAIRPLKNQLLQALAAIQFAKDKNKPLRFHVNATRSETGGDPVLKNLRQLFEETENAELVEHGWFEPEEFISILQNQIDIGLQVSLTETFNVVTADYVTAGLPVVVSKEVSWISSLCQAKDDSAQSIVDHMHRSWRNHFLIRLNQYYLGRFSKHAQDEWFKFCRSFE